MTGTFDWLFGPARVLPSGMSPPGLTALHGVSDLVIAAAFLAMAAVVWRFRRARPDLQPVPRRFAALLSLFLLAFGLAHLAALVVLWAPYHGLEGLMKASAALVSGAVAVSLWRLAPQLLTLQSAAAVRQASGRLTDEVQAHRHTLEALEASRADLERLVAERTEDLRVVNTRFERALTNSNIVLTEQNADLEYTWIFNAPEELQGVDHVGHHIADITEPEMAGEVERFKREVLQEGYGRRGVFELQLPTGAFWYDMKVEPVLLRNGEPGLITVSSDITDLKRQQTQLQVVMRELNHRSKNLLAIVQAVARQTALSAGAPEAFSAQLGARLQALAKAHDVLVRQDWTGADLDAVAEGQLGHLLQSMHGRITVTGEPCALRPESAHYLALALHELGANAVKYGALSAPGGKVSLSWRVEGAGAERRLRLEWREQDGPVVSEAARRGFGRLILEQLAPAALEGEAKLEFDAAGVCWTLSAPLPALS